MALNPFCSTLLPKNKSLRRIVPGIEPCNMLDGDLLGRYVQIKFIITKLSHIKETAFSFRYTGEDYDTLP